MYKHMHHLSRPSLPSQITVQQQQQQQVLRHAARLQLPAPHLCKWLRSGRPCPAASARSGTHNLGG
eukprot:1157442-Pelagomonas_calceolata.AAC.8